jgi:hypothetical protein
MLTIDTAERPRAAEMLSLWQDLYMAGIKEGHLSVVK